MFICKYCGTEFTEHKSNCPNCGAPIKVSENKTPKRSEPNSIREICIRYEGTKSLHLDDTINTKRMTTVREHFNIPANDTIIMVYDDTIFGNNKVGFAVCAGGLFWKNDWSVDTKRTYLSWEDFAKRSIKLSGYHIDLGRGDFIGSAGAGDDEVRNQLVKMLNEIKEILR